jgi:hypothetical protein
MKVVVVFDFPEITDVEGEDATFMIDSLSEDLFDFSDDNNYMWYIDDAYVGYSKGMKRHNPDTEGK